MPMLTVTCNCSIACEHGWGPSCSVQVQLPADVPWKASRDVPSAWTAVGRAAGAPSSRLPVQPGPLWVFGEWWKISIFLPLPVSLHFKQINKQIFEISWKAHIPIYSLMLRLFRERLLKRDWLGNKLNKYLSTQFRFSPAFSMTQLLLWLLCIPLPVGC